MTLSDMMMSTPEGRKALTEARLNSSAMKESVADPTTLDLAVQKHIDLAHPDSENTYELGEDLMAVHATYWPNCYDELEHYEPLTDSDFGEFNGKAICRECGDDLDESLTAFDIEYCNPCAGVPEDED